MGRIWTPRQKNAIEAVDGSVLVSAAAGSGKTAVLVERVIGLITREQNPIDVDRLLIVTFTRAAAAEMRQRISAALSLLLEKDPYNPRLLRQKQLLYTASISTIDSFCGEIVREYFHTLNISRDFRLADDGELQILQNDALELTFEEFYNKNSDDFIALVDAFSEKRGDERLRKTVLTISDFLSTQPFPDKWLDNMLSNYDTMPVSKTVWGQIIINRSRSAVSHALSLTENSIAMLNDADEKLATALCDILYDDRAMLIKLQEKLETEDWNGIAVCALNITFLTLRTPNGYKDDPIKRAIADNRSEVKKAVEKVKSYFSWSEEEAEIEIADLRGLVTTLFELVRAYLCRLESLKSKKNVLSFADVELLTVRLLATPNENGYEKTKQALEISARYDAVMVDEFQDVNDVQDLIFKCVSKNEENLFVVGDVKQSIYGFRQAKPEIFIKRKDSFKKYDENNPDYPALIILDKNFRSRKEVCDATNFVFKRLMTKELSQMDYTDDEKLNAGAQYKDSKDCRYELDILEKDPCSKEEVPELEAHFIAKKIQEMMGEGFTVKDGDTYRRATYGDFAVMLRSANPAAQTYVKVLNDCGVPAYSENKNNCFEAQEIALVLNLLRVIDNPSIDIPLLSVMCSSIYGFTPDELAVMRTDDRRVSLYQSLCKFSEHSAKAKDFLSELDSLRAFACTSSVDDLLGRVYEQTSVAAVTSAVKGGASSSKNLLILREYARGYEKNGCKTLSEFISFIDRMIENGTALAGATDFDSDTLNRVRVMSIHASKGLEFPVCFIANSAHQFNKSDLSADILIDSRCGLGIKKREGLCRLETLPRLAVSAEISRNMTAEELRVLYVAMTRAKEKLIVLSTQKDSDRYLTSLASKIVSNDIIDPYTVSGCKSISDWLCLCALVHPSSNRLRHKLGLPPVYAPDCEYDWDIEVYKPKDLKPTKKQRTDSEQSFDYNSIIELSDNVDYENLLKQRLEFEYVNRDIMSLPQKVSASQIAHEKNSGYFDRVLSKPAFLNKEISSSVERGTAHHRFLQFCDFAAARESLDSELERLKSSGALTSQQAECIDRTKLQRLLQSELVTRILNSPNVMREERFTVEVEPSLIYDEYKEIETGASIIMQGAVDIAFEEEKELVIVDYKTDRVSEIEKLRELYSEQLKLYKYAFAQCTGKKIKECIICSVHLSDYITI